MSHPTNPTKTTKGTEPKVKQDRVKELTALLKECECCGQSARVVGGPCQECGRTPTEIDLARAYLELNAAHAEALERLEAQKTATERLTHLFGLIFQEAQRGLVDGSNPYTSLRRIKLIADSGVHIPAASPTQTPASAGGEK